MFTVRISPVKKLVGRPRRIWVDNISRNIPIMELQGTEREEAIHSENKN